MNYSGLAKDFGHGSLNDEEARALTICGTQEYMAPEVSQSCDLQLPARHLDLIESPSHDILLSVFLFTDDCAKGLRKSR